MTDPTGVDPYACEHALEGTPPPAARPAPDGPVIALQVAVDDQLDADTRAALLREVQAAAEAAVSRVLTAPRPA